MSVELFYNGDVPTDDWPEVDTGECQLRIVCGIANGRGAPLGVSSEGEFYPFAVLKQEGDTAKPVLCCEDCESWLRDLFE